MKLPKRRLIPLVGVTFFLVVVAVLLRTGVTSQVDSYASCAEAGYPISETEPLTCSDGHHVYRGPLPSPVSSSLPAESVPFDILVTGDSGGKYPKQQEVIKTQAEWEHYWAKVHASVMPLPPLLPVDFSTHSVIALSEGQQTTGGYNVRVTSITKSAAGTSVQMTEQIPTVTCKVTESVTNRYFIVQTEKLPEPVSFRITTDRRQCY